MILSIESSDPRFKPIRFHEGLKGMSRSLLKFAERTLLFKSYAASAI